MNKEMTPQEVYDRLQEIGKQSKELHEEKEQLMTSFHEKYQDYELPIITEDGKEKFFRVYEDLFIM